ncbi:MULTISPECIES: dephospho-CoA kinase [Chryseobacterium]|jgi:dephospho-CoA kinase|uniref:Dephospho-CoA kinase n=1 Tax=Chryseobacterium rhizosphaerae TaxID=395937 RepID=A0AAE4C448_9FLAO|nr:MULTISPECIES: dephospho-CoA kinase [Chryseobacterium]MBL3548801.1 dephospho-CoA kinase [Chryseobacterium sp. KMC2]MDC8098409.1 dephospho-CoA kinase [Chryseobacterium rhizosphaerae]MDR6527194.1 dephospho-CoA kinase [Chryseobacterium rhizosphaerae]MDR6546931.1 dephospho-CoA kinase [Chryseobacterium rhizosphaerae]REC78865.1 dephospho-CoA kinase [Chryseobacterium rhizosphaerae]
MEELHSETQQTEPEPSPKIIGLTGGIGSGKTTVARFIEELGFPVYYSDDRAKTIVNDDKDLQIRIKELLGEQSYDKEGLYDRKFVADKVFNNKDLLQKLNEIIHPAVRIDFENWIRKQTKYLVFKETALLFELKLNRQCYKSLLVTAEDNIRIKRVMDRDHKTYREVETIMEKQMPEKDKIKIADCVIYNNTNLEDLKEQTEKIVFSIE